MPSFQYKFRKIPQAETRKEMFSFIQCKSKSIFDKQATASDSNAFGNIYELSWMLGTNFEYIYALFRTFETEIFQNVRNIQL